MGRKAKLRKQRRSPESDPIAEANARRDNNRAEVGDEADGADPRQFVRSLERQGYRLDRGDRAPELPDRRPRPEL